MDRQRKQELRDDSLARTRRELVAERAAALARITRTLEFQLSRLQGLREQILASPAPWRADQVTAYESLRRKAETWLWYLRVQREVNGLHDGETLERRYAIPDRIDLDSAL